MYHSSIYINFARTKLVILCVDVINYELTTRNVALRGLKLKQKTTTYIKRQRFELICRNVGI